MDQDERGGRDGAAEQRRVQLYTRGLNKTLTPPHRRYAQRLAIQPALVSTDRLFGQRIASHEDGSA